MREKQNGIDPTTADLRTFKALRAYYERAFKAND
jgi:hypothetical protein